MREKFTPPHLNFSTERAARGFALIRNLNSGGFTFTELCVTIVVAVLFGAGAFATNSRLLYALRTQKETTAATMVLQQRVESLRACSFTQVATQDYLTNTIFNAATGSEGPLHNLNEQVSVGVYGDATVTPIMLLRNAQNTTPQALSSNGNLTNYNLLQVDLLLQWTSENGRVRTRQLSAVFGKGNIGP
jgi:Tfp pilus assembly protein PilE